MLLLLSISLLSLLSPSLGQEVCVGTTVVNTATGFSVTIPAGNPGNPGNLGRNYHYFNTKLNWDDAKAFCTARNSILGIMDTQAEIDLIVNQIGGADKQFWIGMRRNAAGTFKWLTGASVGPPNLWLGGAAPALNNIPCGQIKTDMGGVGKWNNRMCNELNFYVCHARCVPQAEICLPQNVVNPDGSSQTSALGFNWYLIKNPQQSSLGNKAACEAAGRMRPIIDNNAKWQYLQTLFPSDWHIWLGLMKNTYGVFQWDTDSLLGSFNLFSFSGGTCAGTTDFDWYTYTCGGLHPWACMVPCVTPPPADPCDGQPCLNGGTCVSISASEFRCECARGFYGPLCDTHPCERCWERRGQCDYVVNPANCSEYLQCFRNQTGVETIVRPCAKGLRFDNGIQACVPMLDPEADPTDPANCQDPCNDPQTMMTGYWIPLGECGIFYKCSNYYSEKMCCPDKQSFNISWGDCMFNKTCTGHQEECKQRVTLKMWTPEIIDNITCWDAQYMVKRQMKPDDPHGYIVILDPMTQIEMWCPPGTAFELETCKCSNHTLWEVTYPHFEDCLVDIDFNNMTIIDNSINKFWVDNTDKNSLVLLVPHPGPVQGYALFDGMSHFELPGLQGNALRKQVTVMFWIKWLCVDADSDGGIVSNRGEYGIEPSILIWKNGNVIRAGVRTNKDNLIDATNATLTCGKWFHVALVWDRNWLGLYINCVLRMECEANQGAIYWMMHCPLAVGHDQKKGFYRGCMDDLLICREAFSRQEICDRIATPQIPTGDIGTAPPLFVKPTSPP